MTVLVAVDISEERARIVSADAQSAGEINILSIGSIKFEEFSAPQNDAPEANGAGEAAPSSDALRQAVSRLVPANIDHTFALISGRPVLFETLQLPFNDPKNLSQVVPLQLQDLVPFDVRSVVIDPLPVADAADKHYEILASVLPREDVGRSLERLQQMGLDPEILTTPASAAGGLSTFISEHEASECYALLLLAADHASLTIFADGRPRVLREFPESPTLDGPAPLTRIAQGVKTCIARLQKESGLAVSAVYLQGDRALCEALSSQLNFPTRYIDLSSCYSLPSELRGTADDLGWAIGLMAGEMNRERPLVNFRQGDFAYRPLWGNFINALKEELTWIVLAAFFVTTWIGTQLYTAHSQLAAVDGLIEQEFRETLPGEPVQRGTEATILQQKIAELEEQLRGLGSLSSLSPLESLKELSTAIGADIDITIDKMNIGHTGLSLRGTVPDYLAVGRLNTALEQRKDRFCEVRVDSGNKEPGTSRVRYQAEVQFCE